jgi:hypothetical protein
MFEFEDLGAFAARTSLVLLFDGSSSDFFPNLKKSRFRGFAPLSPSPACAVSESAPSDLSREGVVSDLKGAVESLDSEPVAWGPLLLSICCDMAVPARACNGGSWIMPPLVKYHCKPVGAEKICPPFQRSERN